jgi:hypothetical protein
VTLNKSVKFYLIFILLFLLLIFYFSRNENFFLLLNYISKIKNENFIIVIFFLILISILIIIAGFVMPVLFINGLILNGIWFYQLRNLNLNSYEKYFDIDYKNNFNLNYNRNEFNSILVGHYQNHKIDNELVKYAINKNWKKYSYRGIDFYIDEKCI